MGKALIASDVGGHQELIIHDKTGVLFKAGDEAVLAAELADLLSNQGRIKALERQGRDWVLEHHRWEQTTTVYRDVYAQFGFAG